MIKFGYVMGFRNPAGEPMRFRVAGAAPGVEITRSYSTENIELAVRLG